jgi:hypothetical protein
MVWIREHTPPNALFLVEGFSIYGGFSAVGSDGGWWIPLLAWRGNTMPPQYALLNEAPSKPGYTQSIVELVNSLEKASSTSPENIKLMCEQGITHIYIGQQQGNASASHATQLFSPIDFSQSAWFNLVYHQDRVYIFELDRGNCR